MLGFYFLAIIKALKTESISKNSINIDNPNCISLQIYLTERIRWDCDGTYNYIQYDQYEDLGNLTALSNLLISNENTSYSDIYLEKIGDVLDFDDDSVEIRLSSFFNFSTINSFFKNRKRTSTILYFDWDEYFPNTTYCAWEYDNPYDRYLIDFDNRNWKKICHESSTYFYYREEKHDEDVIVIPTTSSVIIIVSIILGIILLIVSLYFVSYCHCKHFFSEYENSDSLST